VNGEVYAWEPSPHGYQIQGQLRQEQGQGKGNGQALSFNEQSFSGIHGGAYIAQGRQAMVSVEEVDHLVGRLESMSSQDLRTLYATPDIEQFLG
jgi:hypothetical protein